MFTTIAATNVKTNETITIDVAIDRFSANIFFSCFSGPTKKHVLGIHLNGDAFTCENRKYEYQNNNDN